MKDPDELVGIVEDVVARALQAGADEAEAFIKESHRTRVARHGDLARPTESHSVGIGVRVVLGGAIGSASSAGLHRIETVIGDAMGAARDARPHPDFPGLPGPVPNPHPPTEVPQDLLRPQAEVLLGTTDQIFATLSDARTDFASVTLAVGSSRFAVANSQGVATWDQGGRMLLDLELRVAENGRRVVAWDHCSAVTTFPDLDALLPIAQRTERRALGALRPRPLPRTIQTAVLGPAATGQLITTLMRTFNGHLVANGASPVADRMEAPVAAAQVSLHDAPRPEDAPARSRVDHEGVPPRNLVLVDRGIARDTFDDTLSGIGRNGSNGHGSRKGWSGSVSPGLMMPEMAPGETPYHRLIEEADAAVLIEEPLTGMLTASLETGQFSAVLPFAYYIERGEVVHALPNLTVSGNILEVVKAIEAVEDRKHETQIGHFPAIRAGGITCAT